MNTITKAEDILFRCHRVGDIMPSEKARKEFTKTQIDAMVEIFTYAVEHRREFVKSKYLDKGNEREEDSITLLSRVTKKMYNKNSIRLSNKYVTGELDLFEGLKIEIADATLDIKTSWSRITHLKAQANKLEENYKWQGHGYMGLSGAKKHTVAFCLVNGTASHILSEKKKLQWNMGIIDVMAADDRYLSQARQIEINHIFDIEHFYKENPGFDFDNNINKWLTEKTYDIPMQKRVHIFEIARDEAAITAMYGRIHECRKWINENLF